MAGDLDRQGWSVLPKLLTSDESDAVAGLYGDRPTFRSHVVMARHGFGRSDYRYFAYPLPDIVQKLRIDLYPKLAPIANAWADRMGIERLNRSPRPTQLARRQGPFAIALSPSDRSPPS